VNTVFIEAGLQTSRACYLLYNLCFVFLLGLFFGPEDGGGIFF
jgi:hypothetical protein